MYESLSSNQNIQSGSRNQPQFSPCWGCLLHGNGKSIPVLPWPNGTHGQSGRQHPLHILGVYDLSGVLISCHSLQHLINHSTARHSFSMIGYLVSARLNLLLA